MTCSDDRLLRDEKALKTRLSHMEKFMASIDTSNTGGGGGGGGALSPLHRSGTVVDNGGGGFTASRAASASVSMVGGVLNSVASMAGYCM